MLNSFFLKQEPGISSYEDIPTKRKGKRFLMDGSFFLPASFKVKDAWEEEPLDSFNWIKGEMEDEQAGYYGKPCGCTRLTREGLFPVWFVDLVKCSTNLGHVYAGFTELSESHIVWVTSGYNILLVSKQGDEGDVRVKAMGRRHGIPWRFLPPDFRSLAYEIKYAKTERRDLMPWETAT